MGIRPPKGQQGERGEAAEPDGLELRRREAQAYLNVLRIGRELERRVAAMFEADGLTDVTPQQANVLMVLFQERRPLTARALASAMAVSEQTMGRFIRALEETRWVTRTPDPADGRAMLVSPTPKAYETLPRFIRVSNALLDVTFAGFEVDTVKLVAEATERILSNVVTTETSEALAEASCEREEKRPHSESR